MTGPASSVQSQVALQNQDVGDPAQPDTAQSNSTSSTPRDASSSVDTQGAQTIPAPVPATADDEEPAPAADTSQKDSQGQSVQIAQDTEVSASNATDSEQKPAGSIETSDVPADELQEPVESDKQADEQDIEVAGSNATDSGQTTSGIEALHVPEDDLQEPVESDEQADEHLPRRVSWPEGSGMKIVPVPEGEIAAFSHTALQDSAMSPHCCEVGMHKHVSTHES